MKIENLYPFKITILCLSYWISEVDNDIGIRIKHDFYFRLIWINFTTEYIKRWVILKGDRSWEA